MTDTLEALLTEGRTFPRPSRSARPRSTPTLPCTTTPNATGRDSGPPRRSRSTGPTNGTPSSSGTCRSPSGSSAASSTSRTTASTATSRPATATRSPSTGKASPATPRGHLPRAARRDLPRRERRCESFGVEKGDRVAIYMGMVPETVGDDARVRADRRAALGGVRRLHRAVVEGPHQRRGGQGAHHRRRRVAPRARSSRSRRSPTRRWRSRRRSSTCSCCGARRTTSQCRTAATSGGTTRSPAQPSTCPCEEMDSEDLLYLLYTSGTTGKPKGIMHTTGGYLTQCAYTHKHVFDLDPDTDVYWCTADVGWVTGHSYIVYGPLANRTTSVLYEGTPDFPDNDRLLVDRREVQGHDLLHRADRDPDVHEVGRRVPGAPRSVVAAADRNRRRADQPRGVGLVLQDHRRRALPGRRHVVADRDRRHHDQPVARRDHAEARAARRSRCPGIKADIVDDAGKAVGIPGGGYLVLERPWPSMLRGIWGDPQRYRDTYWSRFEGKYFAGDGAKRDDEGYFWLLGRVDDIMLVSGHNISTTEVESALVDHPAVAEAAVVGKTDDTTGQAIAAFVILRSRQRADATQLVAELRDHVAELIGPIAKPKSDPVHRGAAEDPLGQDHAPAAARRRRGQGTRRRHHARRSRRSSTASSRVSLGRPPRSSSARVRVPPRTLDVARRAARARRGRRRRHRRRAVRRVATASTTSSRRARTGAAFFDACGEDRGDRRGADGARRCSTRTSRSCC